MKLTILSLFFSILLFSKNCWYRIQNIVVEGAFLESSSSQEAERRKGRGEIPVACFLQQDPTS
jgi:hypothetical protein